MERRFYALVHFYLAHRSADSLRSSRKAVLGCGSTEAETSGAERRCIGIDQYTSDDNEADTKCGFKYILDETSPALEEAAHYEILSKATEPEGEEIES
ncbi:hypothetical protein MSG28_007017 [Choristoneura fumiferana]|uniref:Uncharacterized protein n=1 Tax=Choristoneura fumiferana TaxID=7141 RepID=A0ACC0JM37_CHOFU|nr:hypothetical protein MSG28_007017 [Choristoneura fumiferana]